MDIKATCITKYHASKSSDERPISAIKWVVMHDTEGGTAPQIARYFSSPLARGSTHLVLDDESCYRTLGNQEVPWAAPGANYSGFHIEMCGYAKWTNLIWRKHMKMLRRAAFKTALHCVIFDIPVRFLKAADLKNGLKGITTHVECSKAFGGDHTDPGPGWPRYLFMGLVRFYHRDLTKGV